MSYTDKLKVELYDEVVNEKNKQYIELSCRFRETCNDIKKKDKEIERLNNIINELNYGIKELDDMFYERFRISQNGYYSISEWQLKNFTDKIKELKGVLK